LHVCKVEINNNKKEGKNNRGKELKEINEKKDHEIVSKNHKRKLYIYKTRKIYKEKEEGK
jgi:hypothetical protein